MIGAFLATLAGSAWARTAFRYCIIALRGIAVGFEALS